MMKELLRKIEGLNVCETVGVVFEDVSRRLDELERSLEVPAGTVDLSAMSRRIEEVVIILNILEDDVIDFSVDDFRRIEGLLYDDYYRQRELLIKYSIVDQDGKFYQADYGRLAGQKFPVPDVKKIIDQQNRRIYWQYKRMEKAGLEPSLQLTPIGYKIKTLAEKMGRGAVHSFGQFFSEGILQYQPAEIKILTDHKVQVVGGYKKNEWIRKNKGWLVELVAAKADLPNKNGTALGENLPMIYQKMQFNQWRPLTPEGYLMAQLVTRGKNGGLQLDPGVPNLLLGAVIPNQSALLCGYSDGQKTVRLEVSNIDDLAKLPALVIRSSAPLKW